MKKVLIAIAALALLGACNREGPAEKAGRQIDQAADKAGRAMQKGADNVRDAVNGKK